MLNSPRPARLRLAVFAGCAFAAAALTHAGNLEPPGPPSPSMKPLWEVGPRSTVQSLPGIATALHHITQPGSYYLTADITGADGKTAIQIDASDVVLDLNGFALIGTSGSDTGINVNGQHVVIENGTLTGWPVNGIWAANCTGCVVRDVLVEGTGTRASAESIWLGARALVQHTTVRGNPNGPGIRVEDGGRIESSTSIGNNIGFFAPSESSGVFDSTATHSMSAGIVVGVAGTVQGCISSFNGLDGIQSGSHSLIRGNVMLQNVAGIFVPAGHSRIEDNLIVGAADAGIVTEYGVTGNSIERNQISCSGGGVGIRISGATGNLVAANLVTDCPQHYQLDAGNAVGEILDLTGGGEITSGNPRANFKY